MRENESLKAPGKYSKVKPTTRTLFFIYEFLKCSDKSMTIRQESKNKKLSFLNFVCADVDEINDWLVSITNW